MAFWLFCKARTEYFSQLFFSWLDSIPRPQGFPKEGPVPKLPAPTAEELKNGLAGGGRQVGSPEEIIPVVKMYETIGVDQLIYSPLTMTMDQKYVLRSIETFGTQVLPIFDTDPVHTTTRLREAALKQAA